MNNTTQTLLLAKLTKTLTLKGFKGEIQSDQSSKVVAASDNSIYEVVPQMVLFPKDDADIAVALKVLQQPSFKDFSLTARGGATGTNGQSLNFGIILDLSRHFNKILATDFKAGLVTVQAGVVLDQLNQHLKKSGYFFPLQISTANRATIGGMFNTDASGKGSLVYGKTSANVQGVKFWNYQAKSYSWQPQPLKKLLHNTNDQWEKSLLVDLNRLYRESQPHFSRHFPKLNRSLTGYNLPGLLNDKGEFDLTALLCGSEGTLGVVSELVLKIRPLLAHKALMVVFYEDFLTAINSATAIAGFNPLAIETMDETATALAVKDSSWNKVAHFLSEHVTSLAKAFNIIEFSDVELPKIKDKITGLEKYFTEHANKKTAPLSCYVTYDEEKISDIWQLRSRGVGLLSAVEGEKKPIAFVEDCAVLPEKLPEFISEFKNLLDAKGYSYGIYGHLDVGCVHVRPALDLKSVLDRQQIRIISDEVQKLVRKYGGIIWGEHGKGVRGEYLEEYLGQFLYHNMRQIKSWFDPSAKFNPGKLYSPLGSESKLYFIDGLPFKKERDANLAPNHYGSFMKVLDCDGNGECFSVNPSDLMCPSMKVSHNKIHSPKGRAFILREWLHQLLTAGIHLNKPPISRYQKLGAFLGFGKVADYSGAADFNHQVFQALDGCLSCKACSSLCPVRIDIPEYKARFLNWYYSLYRRPLSDFFSAGLEDILPFLAPFTGVVNFLLKQKSVLSLAKKAGLVDLPLLAKPDIAAGLAKLAEPPLRIGKRSNLRSLALAKKSSSVILLPDAFLYYYEPAILLATIKLLQKLGYSVLLADFSANGKAQHVKGRLQSFQKTALKNQKFIEKLAQLELPIIAIEPSIGMTYRDEYLTYAKNFTTDVLMIEEFLATQLKDSQAPARRFLASKMPLQSKSSLEYDLFGHCAQSALGAAFFDNWRQIFAATGLKIKLAKIGCCGMAGIFGHEARHLKESKAIFDFSWQEPLDKLQKAGKTALVTGYSCRHQARRSGYLNLQHPVEALADHLGT